MLDSSGDNASDLLSTISYLFSSGWYGIDKYLLQEFFKKRSDKYKYITF